MRITFGRGGGARRVKNPRPIFTSSEPPAPPTSSGTGPAWFDRRGYQLPRYVRFADGDCCEPCPSNAPSDWGCGPRVLRP